MTPSMTSPPTASGLWSDPDLDPLAALEVPASVDDLDPDGDASGRGWDLAAPAARLSAAGFAHLPDNPLLGAAQPLLVVLARMRRWATHPDAGALHDHLVNELRRFEQTSRRLGVHDTLIGHGSRLLCTALDEAAAATPWARASDWSSHSLLLRLHGETDGGDELFRQLDQWVREPEAQRPLLTLFQATLALGFEGRFKVAPQGAARLRQLRDRLARLLDGTRVPPDRALSPRWRGHAGLPTRWRDGVPLWVAAALLGLLVGGTFLALQSALVRQADPIFRRLAALSLPALPPMSPLAEQLMMTPRPAPSRLAQALGGDLASGRLQLIELPDRSVIRLSSDGLFEPGSAALEADLLPLVDRIGAALAMVPGTVLVTGFTDADPIRTQQFPSNWHLSSARADAVREVLAARLPTARLRTRGVGEMDPLGDNRSSEGRARNRRVDISLLAPADDDEPASLP